MQHLTGNLPFHIQDVPATMYVFIRRWVKWTEVPQFYNENILKVVNAINANSSSSAQSPPCMFIHKWDDAKQESELSVAMQTTTPIKLTGGGTIQFPAGKALIANHIGPVDQTGPIHEALSQYIESNNLMLGIAIEEYRTLAENANDPTKMETGIIYRLYDGVEVPRIIA